MSPEWRIRRGDSEYSAPDLLTLQRYARSGRVGPTDYIFHPLLERWQLAREIPEIEVALASAGKPQGKAISVPNHWRTVGIIVLVVMAGVAASQASVVSLILLVLVCILLVLTQQQKR
jgi:hypothetical protein